MITFFKRIENCIIDASSLSEQFPIGSMQSHSKARPKIQIPTQTSSSEKGINADAAFPVANDGAPPGDSLLAVAVGSRCRRETGGSGARMNPELNASNSYLRARQG